MGKPLARWMLSLPTFPPLWRLLPAFLLPLLVFPPLPFMAAARAADVPRFRITIPSGVAHHDPGGTVRFIGTATALVRVRGLAVLIDPGMDDAMLPPALAQADLVVLSQPAWHGTAFPALGTRPIVAMAGTAERLRGMGYRSVYPLDTWESITIRKGDTRLRLTSMPDAHGMRPAAMAVMLNFGPSCRVLVDSGELTPAEIGLIPQRFPGARLALLRQAGTPLLLLAVAQDGRAATLEHPVARGEPYRFGAPDCR